MTPTVHRCPTCGAPLPRADAPHVRCDYCRSDVALDAAPSSHVVTINFGGRIWDADSARRAVESALGRAPMRMALG